MPGHSAPIVTALDHSASLREAFLVSAGSGTHSLPISPELRQAWERSHQAGVKPNLREVPALLDAHDLQEYRGIHHLYRAGEAALTAAADLLEGSGWGIVLADATATVLHMAGDARMFSAAERVGSLPGASWREDLVGNNAIGTSLVTGKPVQFHFHEHWCEGWTDWVCAAAPVRDPESQAILGALALVTHRQLPGDGFLDTAVRLAGTLERQSRNLRQQQSQQLTAEAMKLSRWFPDYLALALDRTGAVVWSSQPLPGTLRRDLPAVAGSLPARNWRGDKEVLLADRYPCLVIPIWSGAELLGHLLITPAGAASGSRRSVIRSNHSHYLVAGMGERRLLFAPEQVLAVRTRGGKVFVVAENGEWPTEYSSIREVQERLPAESFFQVDRGCLVNLNRIKEIHPMFNRTVTLVLADRKGTQIPVSRRRTADLRRFLAF